VISYFSPANKWGGILIGGYLRKSAAKFFPMLYFSRGQKIILTILLAALLTGGGVLLYGLGRQSALASDRPFFVDAPTTSASPARASDIGEPEARPESPATAPQAKAESSLPAGNLENPTTLPERAEPKAATSRRPSHRASSDRKLPPAKPISLNSAGAAQFQRLPGIGPVLAERIVQYRKQLKSANGVGFQSKEQLLEVPGIGPKKYAGLMEHIKL
jgi:DNA uptake protein ComE-like DNA-binding protein